MVDARSAAEAGVSVIVPVWGSYVRYVEKCLRNVLDQTGVDLEVLVVGNGERAPRVTSDPRVRWLGCAERLATGAARNVGLRHATRELVCFADVDDELLPGTLRFLAERMRSRRDVVVWACALEAWDSETGERSSFGWPHPEQNPGEYQPSAFAVAELKAHAVPVIGGALLQAAAVRGAGGFPSVTSFEDWGLLARLAWLGRVCYDAERVGRLYRVHQDSLFHRPLTLAQLNEAHRAIRRWVRDMHPPPPLSEAQWREIVRAHRRRALAIKGISPANPGALPAIP